MLKVESVAIFPENFPSFQLSDDKMMNEYVSASRDLCELGENNLFFIFYLTEKFSFLPQDFLETTSMKKSISF